MVSEQTSRQAFFGVSAILFAGSAAITTLWCASMSSTGEMPMPGGWTMSMAWMRMPGQMWAGAAISFLGMWLVMMMAMMLPSLTPVLWRYRQALAGSGETRPVHLAALAGVGYFVIWTGMGMLIFPLGAALAALEMRHRGMARAVPIEAGVIVLLAGAVQLSGRNSHHLAICQKARGRTCTLTSEAIRAGREGLRLGLHCIYRCAGPTAILLVAGVMNLRVMAIVTAAITLERIVPAGKGVARAMGAIAAGTGLFLIARAAGLA